MRRLATILIALAASLAGVTGTAIGTSDSSPRERDMPIGMCHQYCAIANAQRAAAAAAQPLDAKDARLPQAICHQQCTPANHAR